MNCRKHQTDLSSITGVCASCLRERLAIVTQAQVQPQKAPSDKTPPNFTRRKSIPPNKHPYNKPRLHHSLSDQRFYNSPQIAITSGCIGHTSISTSSKNKNLVRFSYFSNLFKSSSNNKQTGDPDESSGYNSTSVTSSPSWPPGTRPMAGAPRKRRFIPNRGVSPARSYEDGESIDAEVSEGSSDYESAESTSKRTMQNTHLRHVGTGGNKSISGLVFRLSPLVRASPNKLCSIKGKPPVDGGPAVVPSLSYAKSFVANRSRKLADFGRSTDPNR